ncbi:MAG: hypothetical protein JW737_04730 [Acidobacteria bacterium]|nr:hypothetical protein [Acidobacteriota bacterium]
MSNRKILLYSFLVLFLTASLVLAGNPKIVGIEIPSKWGASWKFPIKNLDNSRHIGDKQQSIQDLRNLRDGDVLVIGTHSNPQVFGSGDQTYDWSQFWEHFGIQNPPRLGAVIIAGCTIDITDQDLENIRSSFSAGAVFTPRGSYGMPHIVSTDAIILSFRKGTSFEKIEKQVSRTHFMKLHPSIKPYWTLTQANTRRSYDEFQRQGEISAEDDTPVRGGVYIYIHKFGNGGRIHIGSWDSYNAKKKYRNEWLAGMSEEFLEKDLLFQEQHFNDKQSASSFICGQIGNKRYLNILGWGQVPVGELDTKTYYIDGLGCTIPRN